MMNQEIITQLLNQTKEILALLENNRDDILDNPFFIHRHCEDLYNAIMKLNQALDKIQEILKNQIQILTQALEQKPDQGQN